MHLTVYKLSIKKDKDSSRMVFVFFFVESIKFRTHQQIKKKTKYGGIWVVIENDLRIKPRKILELHWKLGKNCGGKLTKHMQLFYFNILKQTRFGGTLF